MAQYPLNMGKEKDTVSNALALQLTSDGKVKYDVIARQGHRKDKVIYSKLSDMLPSEVVNEDDPALQKPDIDEVADITEKTRAALEKLTNSKVSAALPVRAADKPVSYNIILYYKIFILYIYLYTICIFRHLCNGFVTHLPNKEKNIILDQNNVL